jgi:Tfp pilus assembly protein PilX
MKQKNFSINNQSGVAVLIVLFMLFIATIAGLSILFIASKDKSASLDSSKIRNVALAANAALNACENQLSLQPSVVTEIINKYATDRSYKYLLVTNASSANSEKKVALGSSGLKYAVEISAYDKVNNILQIRGTGYGVSDEQKTVTAIYKLSGVQTATASAQSVRYVLYLAGDGKYFDKKVDITGDVYIGNSFEFNGGSAGSAIHGFLKVKRNTAIESNTNATGFTVDSAVYIGTKFKANASTTFKSKTGIEGSMIIDNTLTIGGNAWFNDTNSGNQSINMSLKTITHSGKVNMARVINKTENNLNALIPDIALNTGLSTTNDSVWRIDTTGLMSKALELPNNLTTSMLQTMYDTCNVSKKFNGYMVVFDKWGSIGMNPDAANFNGKVIWIIRYGLNCNSNFPKMSASSRMILFACSGAVLNGFGCPTGGSYNGIILMKDNAGISMSWSGTNTFNGAIHLTSVSNQWQCNSGTGTQLNLVYNESIINEFETLGVLKRPTQSSGSTPEGTVVLTDFKIRTELVAVNY